MTLNVLSNLLLVDSCLLISNNLTTSSSWFPAISVWPLAVFTARFILLTAQYILLVALFILLTTCCLLHTAHYTPYCMLYKLNTMHCTYVMLHKKCCTSGIAQKRSFPEMFLVKQMLDQYYVSPHIWPQSTFFKPISLSNSGIKYW